MMASRLACAAKTDVGLKRTNNEDNFAVIQSAGLYVLADGMGGHASGQVASTMCVTHVAQYICEMSRQPGFKLTFPVKPNLSYEANLLANAIMFANERVFIQSCKDRSMEGMGTTVTAIFNAPNGLVLAHVGDSRIYRVRRGEIMQMTRDHSLLNHLIDKGELKPEDAASFANKNVILRAIGLKDKVDVDIREVPREKGDIYMMCSDGLSDLVPDQIICKTISQAPNLNEACSQLIGLALKAGGKDNVTVVCVGVEEADSPAQSIPPRSISQPMQPVNPAISAQLSQIPTLSIVGMPGIQPGMPMPHLGMAPMPQGTRAPISPPAMPMPGATTPQPAQRMHSVRMIVERPVQQRTAPKTMPRPIGSAGRMPSAGGAATPASISNHGMPSILPETQTASEACPVAVSPKAPAQPSPCTQEVMANAHHPRKVGAPPPDADQEQLPEASLLLTAPPVAVSTIESQIETDDEENEGRDDAVKTIIECPILTDSALQTTLSPSCEKSPVPVSDHDISEPGTGQKKGYVSPKGVIIPPEDDDGDSIEISNALIFGDSDEEVDDDDVTRQYTRPDFLKKW